MMATSNGVSGEEEDIRNLRTYKYKYNLNAKRYRHGFFSEVRLINPQFRVRLPFSLYRDMPLGYMEEIGTFVFLSKK